MKNLADEEYGTGAVKSGYDPRDFWFEPVAMGYQEWDYDVEKAIGTKLVTKDQGKSSSCGGQAMSYYGEVLERVATQTYEPQSARWIYSQCCVPTGGSGGRTLCSFTVKSGFVREVDAPSYLDGELPTEQFMQQRPVLSDEADSVRDVSMASSFLQVTLQPDVLQQAVMNNYGCMIMVGGENNGTWKSAYPKAPKKIAWRHWMYLGKLRERNGKRYFGVKNSWGDVGDDGWQWLEVESFMPYILEAWTISWDYTAPKRKQILIDIVRLAKQLLGLTKQKYDNK